MQYANANISVLLGVDTGDKAPGMGSCKGHGEVHLYTTSGEGPSQYGKALTLTSYHLSYLVRLVMMASQHLHVAQTN